MIGLASDESGQFAADKFLDGIFGLAFPSLSLTGAKQSPVEMMHDQGEIDEAVVGVWLGRAKEGGGGEMVTYSLFVIAKIKIRLLCIFLTNAFFILPSYSSDKCASIFFFLQICVLGFRRLQQ